MARVTRTALAVSGGYPAVLPLVANSLDVPFTAADAANKEEVVWAEGLTIIAHNTGVGARTITVTSTPLVGRTGDLGPYSIGAGEYMIIANIPTNGFRQTNGKVYFEAEHAEVVIAQVLLP